MRDYSLIIHFDNQQEYTVTFQAEELNEAQINNILRAVINGAASVNGVMVNTSRVLFARIVEIPRKPVPEPSPSGEE